MNLNTEDCHRVIERFFLSTSLSDKPAMHLETVEGTQQATNVGSRKEATVGQRAQTSRRPRFTEASRQLDHLHVHILFLHLLSNEWFLINKR